MDDYFSDWDYYSDDYYDDDPSVKHSRAGAKRTSAATKSRRAHPAPQRNNGVRPQSTVQPDVTSFQGVIWKTDGLEKDQDVAIQIYEPGHGEKVALLENWREVFKSAQPALDKSRLRKRKPRGMSLEDASFADDEFSRGIDERELEVVEEQQHDSSDRMSDITENGDAGNASNTTPEPVQSPKPAPQPMVVVPIKRGRKRKAEVPPDEVDKDNPGGETAKPKRGRPKKGEGKASTISSSAKSASSGPVRRSPRQKK